MEAVSAVRKAKTGAARLTSATQVASGLVDIIIPDVPKKGRDLVTEEFATHLLQVFGKYSRERPYSTQLIADTCVSKFYNGMPIFSEEDIEKTSIYVRTFFENEFNVLFS